MADLASSGNNTNKPAPPNKSGKVTDVFSATQRGQVLAWLLNNLPAPMLAKLGQVVVETGCLAGCAGLSSWRLVGEVLEQGKLLGLFDGDSHVGWSLTVTTNAALK